MPTPIPYGTWPSPITASIASRSGIRFTDTIHVDREELYWLESRPNEGGRSAIIRRDGDGSILTIGPSEFNARTRVHEYGGGAWAVRGGIVFAASFEDQRWYRIGGDGIGSAITPAPTAECSFRFADLEFGSDTWGIAVREIHSADQDEPANDLVRIDLAGTTDPTSIVSGHDFFAAPRLSPDRSQLAWLQWDHPNMPWDGTELWVADVSPLGGISGARRVAGGATESIVQPEWSPDNVLHFASDVTGWWNLYRLTDTGPLALHEASTEFAHPGWSFGLRRYLILDDGRVVAATETTRGDRVFLLGEAVSEINLPFSTVGTALAASGKTIYLVGSTFDRPSQLVSIDVDSGSIETIRTPGDSEFGALFASIPESVTFDTPEGPTYALYYPPTHPDHVGPDSESPPVIVTIHGGPTASIGTTMNPELLYWTSRGFGVLDVNYGGSTGHGRAYRERLREQWGVVDVRDCALAAKHIADAGLGDPNRLVISGGSAGGYTVLMALALHNVFAAGIARYPVTDLDALATDTHKFESRYLDSLIGSYPKHRDRYLDRSPTAHVDSIDSPVLLLQGLEDLVVPPSQPRAMRDALLERGVPVGYIEFEGEGHGFRSEAARMTALEAGLDFLGRVLGFEPPGELAAVTIVGL
jgi:dipeptidyl aminopeptidase/acylaminoacyl peptidase